MNLLLTIALGFASGYVSLSYEILWYRTFAFATWGSAAVFALMLSFFLLGVAMGSSRAKRLCSAPGGDRRVYLARLAWLLFAANVACVAVVPGMAFLAKVDWRPAFLLVALGAGLLGAVLPVLAQFGIDPDDRAGYNLALVYVGNIAGSALGSLVTGFVLMDHLSTRELCLMLAGVGFAAAFAVTLLVPDGRAVRLRVGAASLAGLAAILFARETLYGQIYERLLYKRRFEPRMHLKELVENRHGVIAVSQDDLVYGGGAYDGAFNVSLNDNRNAVHRAVAVAAMLSKHPSAPEKREVLVIGLASGSWAQIIASFSSTKSMTLVEINPGYIGLIRKYPQVKSLLDRPTTELVIDDGRRWLLRHPERTFDFVVMNTSFFWRAHSTNLLSREFLEIVRAHLRPGGILFFNTTSSDDVQKTAATVFPNALRVVNFIAVSDAPFVFDETAWRRAVTETTVDGRPILDMSLPGAQERLDSLIAFGASQARREDPGAPNRLEWRESLLARLGSASVITDDNMVQEWRQPLVFPAAPDPP